MQVSIWTGLIVLAVAIYDIAYAYNKQQKAHKAPVSFYVLGIIFLITAVVIFIVGKR